MGSIYDPESREWTSVERRGAEAVTSHVLLPVEAGGRTRLSLTRIEPGGVFGPHVDDYGHVFCVLDGYGEAMVGKNRQEIVPGQIIETDPGEPHGLWAGEDQALVLVTANVYQA